MYAGDAARGGVGAQRRRVAATHTPPRATLGPSGHANIPQQCMPLLLLPSPPLRQLPQQAGILAAIATALVVVAAAEGRMVGWRRESHIAFLVGRQCGWLVQVTCSAGLHRSSNPASA